MSSRETGLRFTLYIGDLGTQTRIRAEELHAQSGGNPAESVLIAVSPGSAGRRGRHRRGRRPSDARPRLRARRAVDDRRRSPPATSSAASSTGCARCRTRPGTRPPCATRTEQLRLRRAKAAARPRRPGPAAFVVRAQRSGVGVALPGPQRAGDAVAALEDQPAQRRRAGRRRPATRRRRRSCAARPPAGTGTGRRSWRSRRDAGPTAAGSSAK